jgi:hypothetical protein
VEGQIQLGMRGFGGTPYAGNNVELIPVHFRLGITDMWVRGRDAAEAPLPWVWLPRGWTNTFLHEPPTISTMVFGSSPTKTFDVKFRAANKQEITCTAIWNPAPSTLGRGLQTLNTCQVGMSKVVHSLFC